MPWATPIERVGEATDHRCHDDPLPSRPDTERTQPLMKIVVIGGTGLIGSKVVAKLDRARPRGRSRLAQAGHQHDHRRRARRGARRRVGRRRRVELAQLRVRDGARVLRDVDPQPAGRRSGGRRRAPRRPVRRRHGGAVRSAATPTTTTAGYFRAKLTQEALIRTSPIPYSIVHATQFFEFIKGIADDATDGEHGPPAAGPVPADGGRRRRRGGRPGRRRGAGERHRRGRRAGAVPLRRGRSGGCSRRRTTRARS